MKIYIYSCSAISPQPTFDKQWSNQIRKVFSSTRLMCIEPIYKNFIDSKMLRRMSRVIRLGVTAALDCLNNAKLEQPDAIIIGTAYGCLEDTSIFLTKMIENNEEMLTPTAFIQSTHNTVGSQIALMIKCHNYNNTFAHGGLSFESALFDAASILSEESITTVLVGGIDETTSQSYNILNRFGLYRRVNVSSENLFSTVEKGTISGEGATFFLLGNKIPLQPSVCLEKFTTFIKPESTLAVESEISSFLNSQSLHVNSIDLVIFGRNGNSKGDEIYSYLEESLFKDTKSCNYKHLCGEYPTSAAFALWLGTITLLTGKIPFHDMYPYRNQHFKRVLIYNHDPLENHSLFLLTAC